MKLNDLERHLKKYGCERKRQGSNHTIWENPTNNKATSVPRHTEVKKELAKNICKQLGIPMPNSF